MENAPAGRFFFRGFLLGILQPHQKRGRGSRPLSFAVNETRANGRKKEMARCSKCGKVCGTDYKTAGGSYVCKACWDKLPNGEDPFSAFVLNLLVLVGLPIIGIAAIWFVLAAIVVYGPEKLGLPNVWCFYIWLGASTVLSIPLAIRTLKGLLWTWGEAHWFLKVVFCILCPPLVILLIIEWLLKRSHKR